MTPRVGKTEGRMDTAAIAERVRKLLLVDRKEEAGYEGGASWEELEKTLDEERLSYHKLLPGR